MLFCRFLITVVHKDRNRQNSVRTDVDDSDLEISLSADIERSEAESPAPIDNSCIESSSFIDSPYIEPDTTVIDDSDIDSGSLIDGAYVDSCPTRIVEYSRIQTRASFGIDCPERNSASTVIDRAYRQM